MVNQPIKILLLEDDANLGILIEEHLCLQGYKVVLCADGEEGLKRFADRSVRSLSRGCDDAKARRLCLCGECAMSGYRDSHHVSDRQVS